MNNLVGKHLRLNPNKIPDLQWELMDKVHTTGIGIVPKTQINGEQEVHNIYKEIFINSIYINCCSYTKHKLTITPILPIWLKVHI